MPSARRVVDLPKSGFICQSCGEVGFPKSVVRGSFVIEILLWICFIIPGLVYTAWRLSTRTKMCPECAGKMIPIRSPAGRLLAQQFNPHVQIRG